MDEEEQVIKNKIKERIQQQDIAPTVVKSRHLEESIKLTTPTIADLSNMTHTHSTAATGGGISRVITVLIFDDATDTVIGDGAGDIFVRIPSTLNGWNLTEAAAQVQTAGITGTTDIQIHNVTDNVDMLSTVLTVDSGETDTLTAATAAVIDTTKDDVATGDSIRFDVDAVSTTAAKGLLIEMTFTLPT